MARYATTKERGLGWEHVKDKERLLKLHRDGEPCWRCGQPMFKSQGLERDHIVDRALGGTDGPAVLAHAHCNRSAGAKLGHQLQPGIRLPAPPATCKVCGKTYTRPARACEICGAHYHASYGSNGEQRTCSRPCGVILQQRNRRATGWVPKAERPKPPPKVRERRTWPSSRLQHYTCRYCRKLCVAKATAQPREVCPAMLCQVQRLNDNRMRHDGRQRPDWFSTSRDW